MAKLKKQLALVGGAGGKKGRTPVEANDTLRSRAMINFVDLIGEGMIGGLVDGEKSIYFDDVPLQNADGTYNFPRNAFKTEFRTGAQVQDPLTVVSESGTTYVSGVEIKKNIPATFVIDNVEADRVRIIIGLPALFAQQDNGDVTAATVQYSLEMAVNGGSFRPVADDSGKSTFTLHEKTRSKHQRQHTVILPKPAKTWSIRVNRITADSTSSKVTNGTYLDSYVELIDAKFTYPNSAVAATTIDSALFGDIPKRSYFVHGIKIQVPSNYDVATGTYNGIWDGTFKLASSSNPSYIMRDILLSKRYGLGRFISPSQIDNASFYKAGRYCDEMVPNGYGGFEPRFAINTEIAKQVEAYTLLTDIASVFRSSIFWAGAMVKLTQDAPTPVTKIFNQANVHPKGFSYSGSARKDRHSVVIVTWNDPDNGYKQTPEYVEDADLVTKWGIRETQVIAFGCTSRSQAHRVGRWLLYSEASESNLINFDTGLEGAVLLPGEVIQIHDTNRAGKRLGGRLVAGGSLTKAVLDAPVALPATAATIAIMMPDGAFLERTIKQINGDFTEITWDSPLPEMPVANALWTIALPNLKPMQARVVGVTQNKDDESFYSVTAVEHNPLKFAAIEEGIALERPLVSLVDERPAAPGKPTFYPSRYAVMNESFGMKGLLSWEGNSPRYVVSYRRRGNSWIQVNVDQATFEVPNVELATYDFEIIAVSPLGKQSPVATLSYEVSGSTLVMGEVIGLELESGSTSEEVKVKWLRTPAAVGYEVQVVDKATGKIARKVAMGNVQRFEYSLADSKHDGGPFRSVIVKVRALGAAGEKGPWAEIITGNPQIGELLGLTLDAGIRSFFITFDEPTEPDFAGALAWISTDPKCPTTPENLVYDNSGTLIFIKKLPDGSPLLPRTDYYIRVAGYDSYGRDALTYSSALAGQVETLGIGEKEITAEMLQDGVINTAKFAQGVEPIRILSVVNDATPYQNVSVVMSASDGEIYRWSLTEKRYTKDINVANVTGTFGPGQIAPGAIDATKVADGLQFVGIVTELPNPIGYTGTPVVLYQNKIHRLVNGKWESNIAAADVVGQFTSDHIAQGAIDASKMAPDTEVIQRVTSLPAVAGYAGPQVLLYQGKLYRLTNGKWETGVETGDIIGQITADKLASGSVRFDTLAPGLEVIGSVTALPVVKGYVGPKVVLYNGKLHRLVDGQWKVNVDADDITGTLSSAHIGAGTIDTSKLASGLSPVAVVTSLPATAGYVGPKVVMFQDKLYRLTATGWVTTIAAADIAGTIQATQIAAIEASKVTGQLSDTQIAAVAAAKISGTIVNGQIAAGAVTASKISGGATGFALNADPGLTDAAAWVSHYNSALAPNFVSIDDGLVGNRAVRKVGSVGLTNFWNYTAERIPVVAGERYRFTAVFRRTADTPALIHFTYRPFGPGISASDYRFVSLPLTTVGTWTRLETVVAVPAGLVAISPGFSMNHGSSTGVVEMQDFRFEAVLPSGLLLEGIITETKIAKDAITAPKIAAGAIVAGKLDVNAVVAGNIAANAVTTDKLMAGAVSTGKLDALAVTAEKIAAGAVTTPKIEAGAVKAAQIDAGAVTTAKLDALAVTADKIAVRAITAEKLDVGAVTANKIAAGAVTADAMAAFSITASKMAIGDMTNLCLNGNGLSMDGWGPGVPGGMTATTEGFLYWGQFGLAARSAFNVACRDSTFGAPIPVVEGQEFHLSADTTPFGGGQTLNNFGLGFQLWDGDGHIAGWAPVAVRGVGTMGYRRIAGVFRVPAGIARVNVWLQIDGANGVLLNGMGVGHHVTNIEVRRRAAGELIVDGAITADKIQAKAIKAGKLDTDAVTAGSVAASAITGREIKAGSITADKLLIATRGATINEDPYLKDPTAWFERDAPANGYVLLDIADGPVFIGGAMNTSAPHYNLVSRPFAVVAGKTYRITVWTRSFNGANGANYVRLYRSGPGGSYYHLGYENVPVVGPWTPLTFTCKIENGINVAQLSFHANWGGSQGNVQIQDFRIEEVLPSTLIQDGAITTDKLTVGAVTAEKILTGAVIADKIGAGQVVAGKLSANSVIAGNVSAEAIGAREIKAGSITTNKLLVIPESLIPDSTFKDWEFWAGPGTDANGWWADNDPGGMQASRCAILWSGRYDYVGTARKHIFSNPIQMTTGGQVMRMRATVNNNSNQDCYVEAQIFGAVGQWLATATITARAHSGVLVHRIQFSAPEACSFARIVIYNQAGYAFQNVIYVTNVLLDRANGADMIVDGAVISSKIATGAITAEKIEARAIKAGALDVDAVTAGTIAAGAINTRELAAGAVTVNKLGAGLGANVVPNTTFVSNDGTIATGWTYGETVGMGMRVGLDWPSFKPATGHCMFMEQTNTWYSGSDYEDRYGTLQSPFVPCEPGQRYEFSVYSGCHRTTLTVAILFYAADGSSLLANVAGQSNFNEAAGGVTMDTWKRIGGFAYAPAGAASVRIELRKGPTDYGQSNSYAFWTMPMIAKAGSAQTEFSAWQPTGLFTTITADGLATGAVTADKIKAGSVKADHIEALAIKTNHLEAQSVDATKIKAKSIEAGQIKAGAIGVDEIAAGAIVTKHLAVGDFENLVNCGTGMAVHGFAPHIVVQSDYVNFQNHWWAQLGKQSPYTLLLRGRDNFYGPMIPVSADDEFYCSIMSVPSGNVAPTFGLAIGVATYNAAGQITNWIAGAARPPGFAGPHFAEGVLKIPRDGVTTMIQVWLQINGPGNANWDIPGNSYHIGGLTVRRRSAGKLIVDGAITADKIEARSIYARHINVGEIRAEHIRSETIKAEHIDVNTIKTRHIDSKQIISDHIQVTNLSAISSDLGAVTAGSINIGGGRFVVDGAGNLTVRSAMTGARMEINASQIQIFDVSGALRVRMGVW